MGLKIGIDLGSRSLKVVAGEMKGPLFVLHRTFTVPVEAGGEIEDQVLAAVAGLKEQLPKGAGSRFGVSGKELIIRYTQVPQVPTWRLRLLMDFEVREMSHQAGEPLASNYNLVSVPGKGGGDETMLVAVVKEHFLAARQDALAAAIGAPTAGIPASIALFNSYLHSGALHEGEYVFLVDIGDRNTEIVLLKDSELLFARNIAAGSALLTDAIAQAFGVDTGQAESLKEQFGNVTPKGMATYTTGKEEKVANAVIGPTGQLASMLQSSLAFSRAQTGIKDLKVGRILLSGGGANLRGIPEYLSTNFGCPVERFQPSNGLELAPLDAEEAAGFERDPGSFAVALGLALSGAKKEAFLVDLVPARARKKRDLQQRTLFTILSGVAALAFLVVHFVQLKGEKTDLEKTERTARVLAQNAKNESQRYDEANVKIRELNQKQRALDELTTVGFAVSSVPRIVQELCPDGVWISQVDVRPVNVPFDDSDPKKGGEVHTVVTVEGRIVSLDQQTNTALTSMIESIKERRPDWKVGIKNVQGGEGLGSKKMDFKLSIEPWPIVAAKPPEETSK